MNSGQWITFFLLGSVTCFVLWELIQLARRRRGNQSARTMSQYINHRIKNGSRGWLIFAIAFPIFIALVGIWLLFHWAGICEAFGIACEIDI